MTKGKSITSSNCYKPSEELVNLMTGLHNLELERIELEKEISAGKITDEEVVEKKENLRRRRRALATEKVRILNAEIFPSMANMIVFLEFMLISPYLHRHFEEDLKSLFFAKSNVDTNSTGTRSQSIFARFIEACGMSLISEPSKKDGIPKTRILSDFRFILWEIMMDKIWMIIPGVGEYKFKNDTFLNNVLYADIGRAVAWMRLFAHEAHGHVNFDKDKRPALF